MKIGCQNNVIVNDLYSRKTYIHASADDMVDIFTISVVEVIRTR